MAPVPIYVKGGVWSNLEDQIVKAAIQKYGTHQWSKIASLLQKKTAKQCETRWNEYLNPKLNFSEFSKEEDARLLDLAGKLPNQWRSIADAMGRTAQVCIERYNLLLEGDEPDSEMNLGSSLEFNVGDLNPRSDTLAAKPDGTDLGDDEREMLAEARARLLNTQGKKATRKVRERMLEESKRIAQLQKRRELKQAGVKTTIKQAKKRYATELDYNQDVVYEQAPLPGVYDTSEEDARLAKEFREFEKKIDRQGMNRSKDSIGFIAKTNKRKTPDEGLNQTTGGQFTGKILTDEYKKPTLSLPKPGAKVAVSGQDIEVKRRKLLADHSDTPLLKVEDEQTLPVQIDKKQLLQSLFASLPEPKNDYEVVLDSEGEDKEGESTPVPPAGNQSGSASPALSGETLDSSEMIPLELLSLEETRLPTPGFTENPKNEYEQTFNELVATSLMKEKYMQPKDYLTYLRKVEDEMKQVQLDATEFPQDNWGSPTQQQLQEAINSKRRNVHELQKQLAYVAPITAQNDHICRQICGEQLARVRNLQHRYYTNYKMYQQEVQGIDLRRQRLKSDIEEALNP